MMGLEMYYGARMTCSLSNGKPVKGDDVVLFSHNVARVIGVKYVVGRLIMYPRLKVWIEEEIEGLLVHKDIN